MIKILSWNIRQGGGTRIAKIFNAVKEMAPHIVVFNEYRNNNAGINIRHAALKLGYRYQLVTAAGENVNSVIVLSKFPCNGKLFPKCDPIYPHNIIAAEFEAFSVYGMYLPHKKKHNLLEFMLERSKLDGKPMIFCGDFNSGINYVDQKGNSFWYEDELKELDEFCVDAFRNCQGGVQEYSWYSHQGNGYRYDHTYVHHDLLPVVKDCYYAHEYREAGLSDHSPMILEIGG